MRKYTNMVLDMIDEGVMSPQAVAEMCLQYMSEADVEDMCRVNDILPEEDDEDAWDEAAADFEDSLEEVDDGQPDEHTEWMDFDPDC